MMGERTKWEGLWKQRAGVYSGYAINKDDIPEKSTLIVRYNKNYDASTKRPFFVYTFADSGAKERMCTSLETEEFNSLREQLDDLSFEIGYLKEHFAGVELRDSGGYQVEVYGKIEKLELLLDEIIYEYFE